MFSAILILISFTFTFTFAATPAEINYAVDTFMQHAQSHFDVLLSKQSPSQSRHVLDKRQFYPNGNPYYRNQCGAFLNAYRPRCREIVTRHCNAPWVYKRNEVSSNQDLQKSRYLAMTNEMNSAWSSMWMQSQKSSNSLQKRGFGQVSELAGAAAKAVPETAASVAGKSVHPRVVTQEAAPRSFGQNFRSVFTQKVVWIPSLILGIAVVFILFFNLLAPPPIAVIAPVGPGPMGRPVGPVGPAYGPPAVSPYGIIYN